MDTIGIYKDNFDQIFQRLGWHDIQYKSTYSDPEVIRQRWLSPPNIDKKFSKQAFFDCFGDNTFRKILSFIYAAPRTKDELTSRWGKLDEHVTFMLEQEIVVQDGDLMRTSSQYEHVTDIGKTLEWYVAEWFRSSQKVPARHGVKVPGVADGGDLDVVAFSDGSRIFVECKSGNPANIAETQLELFLRRVADFNPSLALLLIDTDSSIEKQIEMLKKVYTEKHLKNSSISTGTACDPYCVHVRNVKTGIAKTLLDTLRRHSIKDYSDRPLVGLSKAKAQSKMSAEDHLKAIQRRLEISWARENITLQHTLAAWMEHVGSDNYRYIQEVFPGESPAESVHRNNCKMLIRKGLLRAEDDDGVTLGPFIWDPAKRYCSDI